MLLQFFWKMDHKEKEDRPILASMHLWHCSYLVQSQPVILQAPKICHKMLKIWCILVKFGASSFKHIYHFSHFLWLIQQGTWILKDKNATVRLDCANNSQQLHDVI